MLSFAALNFALNSSKTAASVVKHVRQSKTYRNLRTKIDRGQLDRRMANEGKKLAEYLDGRRQHGLTTEDQKSPIDKQNEAMAAALKNDLKARNAAKKTPKAAPAPKQAAAPQAKSPPPTRPAPNRPAPPPAQAAPKPAPQKQTANAPQPTRSPPKR